MTKMNFLKEKITCNRIKWYRIFRPLSFEAKAGIFWIASRPDKAILWSQAGRIFEGRGVLMFSAYTKFVFNFLI